MAVPGRSTGAVGAGRHLVFRLAGEDYAMDAANVREVIRTPPMTRVPHAPAALAGIANLRGIALPVVSVAELLDPGLRSPLVAASTGPGGRHGQKVVIYDQGELVGLIVDDVVKFGAASAGGAQGFDPQASLAEVFDPARGARANGRRGADAVQSLDRTDAEATALLVAFEVAGQKFALPIGVVHEILRLPGDLATAHATGDALRGVVPYRDTVLPVVSLAVLIGLAEADAPGLGARIVVVDYQGATIGLVVDRIDAIRRVTETQIDALPPVLRRGGGTADITSIARLDGGRTLVSILSAERLFGHSVIEEAVSEKKDLNAMMNARETANELEASSRGAEKFLIFALGSETYGLPVAAVDEVVRVPDTITRVPNAPAFVRGIMNLRGRAVPLIDQRLRFDAPAAIGALKPRAIVLTIGDLQAGFVVDGTAEIMAIPSASLTDAFGFATAETHVFDRVAHIETDGRMILLVDPHELLSRAEQDVVATLVGEPATGSAA